MEKHHKFTPDKETLARVITEQYEKGKISLPEYEIALDFLGVEVEERVSEEELAAAPF